MQERQNIKFSLLVGCCISSIRLISLKWPQVMMMVRSKVPYAVRFSLRANFVVAV